MRILQDNSPIPQELLERCQTIQQLAEEGRCELVNLLDPEARKEKLELFRLGLRVPQTGNFVGQFEYRDKADGQIRRVVIADRFGPREVTEEDGFLSPFVQEMLRACWGETPFRLLKEAGNRERGDAYSLLLAMRLAVQMERAWKRGRLRLYRTESKYDSRVRGRLDIPRKIRRSMGLQDDGAMAYQIREFSGDNAYNRLFYQACLAAEKRYPFMMGELRRQIPGFRGALQDLKGQSGAWGRLDTGTLLVATRKKIVNPVYRDYETLRGIARAVLQRVGGLQQMEAPDEMPMVTGVFLDVSQLWENYLARRVLPGLPEAQKPCAVLGGQLWVKPDFLWPGRAVLDAKYRLAWGKTLGQPWEEDVRDDVYQVLSYMLVLNCGRGGVIFPVSGSAGMDDDSLPVSEGGETFWRFPFFVPAETDPETFRRRLEQEEARAAEQLRAFI